MFFKKNERQEKEAETAPEQTNELLQELKQKITETKLPALADKVARKELSKLEKSDPATAEYGIGLNYLEFILALPWNLSSKDNLDLMRAEHILNARHYGLGQVKERVLEHLATSIVWSTRQYKIIVVDDEEIARENTAYALRKSDCEVTTATNGQEALELVSKSKFDLVVTDLKMDKMDGLELLKRIKRQSPTTDIILVTGYATVDTAVDALQKGAAHYLPKPLNLEVLRRTVNELRKKRTQTHQAQGPVMCFTGPPGTGKTSIGRAVAEALERRFVRLSMAGLRDEAELRGHRRTYVGAMAGRIINEIKRCGVNNPVFMLDELDKIGQDFHEDPASVLLEVLDPEQNKHFMDYYLDIPFDLSGITFITTANVEDKLPAPLLDRMELIRFPSYTPGEKRHIGLNYILPRQLQANGRGEEDVSIQDEAMNKIIREYTRGAGLRGLEREIGGICRKINRLVLMNELTLPIDIKSEDITGLLGPARFRQEEALAQNMPGVTTGLVWTEVGGSIIFIETASMHGSGQLIMTGSLGDILKESARTALSYVRSNAVKFGIDDQVFGKTDVHVHIPAGGIPKDGPSAGLTIALAFVSLFTQKPARRDVAMSSELTLSGRLLPVSGLRDKILAAAQAGIKTVLLADQCRGEVETLVPEVREVVEVLFVSNVFEAAEKVLE